MSLNSKLLRVCTEKFKDMPNMQKLFEATIMLKNAKDLKTKTFNEFTDKSTIIYFCEKLLKELSNETKN